MNKERIIEILRFISSRNIGGTITIYNNAYSVIMRVSFSNYDDNMTVSYYDIINHEHMCLITHKSNVDTIWDNIGERINPDLLDK